MNELWDRVAQLWHDRIVDKVDTEYVEANWFLLLVAGAAVVVGGATIIEFLPNHFYVNKDSALFQHAGWYILEGGTLYVDIWDLKPPLIYGVTTLLALGSFGNMAVLHVYGVTVAVAAVVWGVIMVGVLVHRLTDDPVASLAAAGTMFVVPSVYAFPYAGIRPKYLAFACGATALVLAVDDRYAASGAVAACSAAFWQLGGILALLVVGMGATRGGRRGFLRTVGGSVAVTVAVVLPFVLTGLTIPLFVETVIAPVYGVERYTIPGRLLHFIYELGYGILVVPVGIYGCLRAASNAPREYWWVGAGGTLYLLQVFLELQGAIEVILLLLFLAIGVGLAIANHTRPSRRSVVVGVVVLLVLGSLFWAKSPVTPVKDRVGDARDEYSISAYPTLPPDPPGSPSMQTIYWEKQKPEMCHYRLGHKQKYFMHITNGSLTKEKCGQWPFEKPPVQWVVDGLVPF